MSHRFAIFAIVATACVTDPPTEPTDCGPIPRSAGYTVRYAVVDGAPVAIVPRADFEAITANRHDLKAWALCASGE
jgi:hypothetical protein